MGGACGKETQVLLRGGAVEDLSGKDLRSTKFLQTATAIRDLTLYISFFGLLISHVYNRENNKLHSVENLPSEVERLNVSNNRYVFRGVCRCAYGFTRIVSCKGIHLCSKLKEVDISHNEVTDLTPLAGLTTLTKLNASHNQLEKLGGPTVVSGVGRFAFLRELDISRTFFFR